MYVWKQRVESIGTGGCGSWGGEHIINTHMYIYIYIYMYIHSGSRQHRMMCLRSASACRLTRVLFGDRGMLTSCTCQWDEYGQRSHS